MFGLFERRKHTRFSVDLPVDITIGNNDSSPFHTHIREASVEGLTIVTEKRFDENQLVKLVFEIPRTVERPRPTTITVEGHVIHVKRRDERFFEVGFSIDKIADTGQEAYGVYLAYLAKQ